VPVAAFQPPVLVFQPPEVASQPGEPARPRQDAGAEAGAEEGQGGGSRRRRRGGRGRGKGGTGEPGSGDNDAQAGDGQQGEDQRGEDQKADKRTQATDRREHDNGRPQNGKDAASEDAGDDNGDGSSSSRRRRRRRQRGGAVVPGGEVPADDPAETVVHVREPRAASESDDVRAVKGSTRLEAKRQRRREGRDTGRRRPPIITESEFLARREAVERVMAVRQQGERTQIAVLEDGVLVEHYVDKASHQSYVGNVYLGKVQNVLPSMEAAFVDIGKGRNAVLYAGEVNFDASGLEGVAKRIESALKSGQSIMVQVTKDPIGHKGARLTSQVSLPGRYLVYVPGASMTGISRKLPDTERNRLKQILKKVAPEEGGIIVRTAAEGASEEELQHDVTRLVAQWQAIERKAKTASAPDLLYGEPDLTIRVVRDIFNEDFTKLVIASDSEWDLVDEYVRYVAPNLAERLERWSDDKELFTAYRIDEQLTKALDRKVWLPSGGSLVIDTTEAMTVIDVNTGKFTGQGGNLEQTVTRNNLEAAEEIVRQLRLRDIGGIIVIDFIDMVLESNRDLVLRRLIECLARDRTKHQVAEVTSLGLVQMTRKRVGSGLLAAFSVPCEHCNGRGILVSTDLTELPHAHGRNGSQGGTPKPGPGRSRSARSKAIAQVAAAKSADPEAAVLDSADEATEQKGTQDPGTSARGKSGAERPAARSGRSAAKSAAAKAPAGTAATSAEAAGPAAGTSGATAGTAADAASTEQDAASTAQDPAEAAPRRRPRRSAHREAGPPDAVKAARGSAAAAGDGAAPAATAEANGEARSAATEPDVPAVGTASDGAASDSAPSDVAASNGDAPAPRAEDKAGRAAASADAEATRTSARSDGQAEAAGAADAGSDAEGAAHEASPSAPSE
jgi:ribonuclease E